MGTLFANTTPELKVFGILNLYSYDNLNKNSLEIKQSLKKELAGVNMPYVLYNEYLNYKNFEQKEYFELLSKFYLDKYKNTDINLILATNQISYEFLREYKHKLFPNAKVIVSKVNNIVFDDKNSKFSFIKEENSIHKMIAYIEDHHENINHIYILSDQKKQTQDKLKKIKEDIFLNDYDYSFEFSKSTSLQNIRKEIHALKEDTIIIIYDFNFINNKKITNYQNIFKSLFDDNLVYAMSSYELKKNNFLGSLDYSNELLGRSYALLIKVLLKGNILDKSIVKYDLRIFTFNEQKLSDFNIYRDIFPEDSIILNKIEIGHNLFHEDEYVFTFLLFFISCSLFFMIFLINKMLKMKKSTLEIEDVNIVVKESEAQVVSLLDNLPGIVYRSKNIYFDEIEYLSKGVFELIAYTKEQILESKPSYLDIILPSYKKEYKEKIKTAIENKSPYHIRYEIKTFNDEIKTVYEIGIGVYDSSYKLIAIEGSISDITELSQAQNKILKLNANLEHTVYERTVELEESNKELQRLISSSKQSHQHLLQSEKMASLGSLVAGVSHEINTPIGLALMGITHFSDITCDIEKSYKENKLDEKDFELYLETSNELANTITTSLIRAADLIKSFKQIAVDQSSEEIRTFDLEAYVKEVLLSIRNKTKKTKHKINIICKKKIIISSYPGAISQIITNLVMNSISHAFKNKEEGIINIHLEQDMKRIHISYSDNGIGIKKEYLAQIYDPFFTTAREEGGSGLGLNILYNIVTSKLKGSIKCNSMVDVGTEFKITFILE
ncbi:MAG: PAS domain-containing sensor histidine kinase [Campylobacteraceae bacterium]|nr:PAS domain-containing sensor histidine kinase [Campylobacteraceae bacterium]